MLTIFLDTLAVLAALALAGLLTSIVIPLVLGAIVLAVQARMGRKRVRKARGVRA